MGRVHLIEIEDQSWCPAPVRDGATDFLEFIENRAGGLRPIVPKLRQALQEAGTKNVVDLCSGGAGPWPTVLRELDREGFRVDVQLTDLHPNADAFARIEGNTHGRIRGLRAPVDATNVPETLRGFRTLFNAFHHFPPELAKAILADAVRARAGIALFEAVQRSALQMISIPLMAMTSFLFTPFIRPFRWSRLLLTYVVPLIPGLILFDGLVSCLRVYSPDELRALVAELGDVGYEWDIGKVRSVGPAEITYLIGTPRRT